jgi:hypothetical protein
MAELIVVDQVLVAERNPEHALAHERCHPVLRALRIAPITEAARKTRANASCSGLHSVGIGELLWSTYLFVAEDLSLIQSPDAPPSREKCGLAGPLTSRAERWSACKRNCASSRRLRAAFFAGLAFKLAQYRIRATPT